jgi:DeoR family glycerol-3-phosphate regulon repressor
MQELNDRQNTIVALARSIGKVTVEDLAVRFEVTPQTIRRDLNELCDLRVLSRTHGGAVIASSVENLAYEARRFIAATEKRAIGAAAAALIPNECSLFINIGTTTESLARALLGHEDLRVITNNLNVAQIMTRNRSFTVMVTGGTVRNRDGGIIGQSACDMIGEFRVDYGIIGISGIDEQGTLLDFDYDEVRAARAIIRNSRATYLLADHTKFSRHPMVRMGSLSEVSALFTDVPPPPPLRERLIAGGVVVHVTEPIGP